MPGRRASQRDRHEHMLLVECETPDCHRMFCSSKHTRCCSNCGALALNGEWSHTGRCQKQQRHLGRRGLAFVSGAMTSCSTDGCGRLHTPGYRACCSRCANFRGTRHSRRCDDMHRRSGGALVATPAAPESNTVVPNRGTDSWPGASMASMAALAPASSSSSATASASALASASLASAGVPHGGMSFYPEMGAAALQTRDTVQHEEMRLAEGLEGDRKPSPSTKQVHGLESELLVPRVAKRATHSAACSVDLLALD